MITSASQPTSLSDCTGCSGADLSRRRFLQGMLGVAGAAMTTSLIGDVFTEVAYGATAANPNVLVVLSLRGGADGLSLVVPHGDPAYAAARPRLAIPTETLIAKDSMFGLHPAFEPLLPMWQAGTFGAVHAAGLPQPNRSHFEAMEQVEDAAPGSDERRGWLNRVVGLLVGDDPEQAVQIGNGIAPTSLYGPAPTLSLSELGAVRLPAAGTEWEDSTRTSLQSTWHRTAGVLGTNARSALDVSERLGYLATPTPPQNGAVYPGEGSALGKSMAQAAQLIRAQAGARVIAIDAGGWDMHAGIGAAQNGIMAYQVSQVARSLAAFFTDLGPLAANVTVVTITEFGRRVSENGGAGLDHGYGSCMFALGAGVKGGRVHTRWPGLGSGKLVDGDLAVTVDHRSVLAEIIGSRFPELKLGRVFPGFKREKVGIA
jgi:uncharacterized protein (DUF1501 family)